MRRLVRCIRHADEADSGLSHLLALDRSSWELVDCSVLDGLRFIQLTPLARTQSAARCTAEPRAGYLYHDFEIHLFLPGVLFDDLHPKRREHHEPPSLPSGALRRTSPTASTPEVFRGVNLRDLGSASLSFGGPGCFACFLHKIVHRIHSQYHSESLFTSILLNAGPPCVFSIECLPVGCVLWCIEH